jgi:hypothetical protein
LLHPVPDDVKHSTVDLWNINEDNLSSSHLARCTAGALRAESAARVRVDEQASLQDFDPSKAPARAMRAKPETEAGTCPPGHSGERSFDMGNTAPGVYVPPWKSDELNYIAEVMKRCKLARLRRRTLTRTWFLPAFAAKQNVDPFVPEPRSQHRQFPHPLSHRAAITGP